MKAETIQLIFIFILGLSLSLYLTPLMAEAARRFGLVAKPDGRLRLQPEPVPYLGGVAIYLAFLLALVFGFGFEKQVLGLLLGGTIILLVGLIDVSLDEATWRASGGCGFVKKRNSSGDSGDFRY